MRNTGIWRKLTGVLLVLLLLSVGSCQQAWADNDEEIEIPKNYTTADLMDLEQQENVVVSVSYDKELPDIYFIAPNGDVYAPGKSDESKIYVEYGSSTVYYYLPNARRGSWQIAYDKKTNSELTVNFGLFSNGIWIDDFQVTDIDEDDEELTAVFQVSYDEDASYHYTIYAVTMDEDGSVDGQKEIGSGYADANEEVEETFSIDQLESYDYYHFMLEVELEENGNTLQDQFVTEDEYTYVNEDTPEAMEDFTVTLNLETGDLVIDWSDYTVWCDEYIVAVFEDREEEPFYNNTFDSSVTRVELLTDTELSQITVELHYRDNDRTSEGVSKSIPCKASKNIITIDTPEFTNAAQAVITYDVEKETTIWVSVNGETEESTVKGSGNFSINLEEDNNQIQVLYKTANDDNLYYLTEKEIYADHTAPLIHLYEDVSGIKTQDESFVLVGDVESGASLTVNGEEVEVAEDGTFSTALSLIEGENSFELAATDIAGNVSKQTISITRIPVGTSEGQETTVTTEKEASKTSLWKQYLPLGITVLGTLLAALTVIISYEVSRKKTGKIHATVITLRNLWGVLTILGAGGTVYTFIGKTSGLKAISGKAFLELAQDTIQEAYEAVITYHMYEDGFTIFLIGTGISLVLWVLFALIAALIKKHGQKQNKTENETDTEPVQGQEEPVKASEPEKQEDVSVETAEPEKKEEAEKEKEPEREEEPEKEEEPRTAQPEPTENKKVFCRYCGNLLKPEAKFCNKCGKKLS
jgi:hypothetical protein